MAYAKVVGQAYTSYDVLYGANDRPASASYSNGLQATYTYNAAGWLQEIAYTGVKGQAYTSYEVFYESDGKVVSVTYSNGKTGTYSYNNDGSYQIAYSGAPGTIDKQAYTTYTIEYNAAHVIQEAIYYNAAARRSSRSPTRTAAIQL